MNLMYILIAIFSYYFIVFIIGQRLKNNSIVDVGWGMSFVVSAWLSFILGGKGINGLIASILVTIWGVRLTYHIFKRNHGKAEDFRYVNFRKQWGDKFALLKAFLHVYMLQMLMSLMISSAFIYTNLKNDNTLSLFTIVGVITWLIGFYFESRGDYQLKQFKSDKSNKGKLLVTGLYKYTRHPNYFGEAVMWWGIYLIAVSHGMGWLTVVSPLTITILVRFISGVPMLEKHYEGRSDFEAYAKKTSIFIPLPPKS